MQPAFLLKVFAKTTAHAVVLASGVCLVIHLIAAVSFPVLKALGAGMQRVNTTQVVAISPEPTSDARETGIVR